MQKRNRAEFDPVENLGYCALYDDGVLPLGEIRANAIYIGAVAEDSSGYPDCRPEFYEAFQRTIDTGTKPATQIEIRTPIIHISKARIVKKGIELEAPLHLTWSCYLNEAEACGRCDSCALRLRGFAEAGLADPIRYKEK